VAAEFTELTKSWATILWLLACEDFAMPFGPGRRDPFHCVTAGGRAYLRRRDCVVGPAVGNTIALPGVQQ